MKCPRRFKIVQNIITINKDTEELRGEGRFFIESQEFEECYKDDCPLWNKEKQSCKI